MSFCLDFFRQPPLPLKPIFREPFALALKDSNLNGCAESNRLRGDGPNSSTQSWRMGSAICHPLHYLLSIAAHSGPSLRRDLDAVRGSSEWAKAQPKKILPIAFCPLDPHLGELRRTLKLSRPAARLLSKFMAILQQFLLRLRGTGH